MDAFRRVLSFLVRRREWGLVALIAAVVALVSVVDARFLAWDNLRDLLVRAAPTAIVACGVMLVIVTAEIDISVGSLMAILAALLGLMVSQQQWQWPLWLGIPLTLTAGTACGLLTGSLVALGRVPSIIVTLGLLTALRGITTLVMGGENIDGLPASLGEWCKIGFGGLPLGVWTAAAVVVVTGALIAHTQVGRRLYALGSSAHSARMAGLSERRLKLFVFAYTGFLTAVATIVDVPRLPKIESGIGAELELLVVTCVVVGGVSISGGRGTLIGVLLAVVLMTMVRPVLTFLDVGESGEKWTKAIQGLFILLAILSDRYAARWHESARRGRPSPPLPRR
jgi:ribose/xylose/arabinose/galactoside ABC-type transport system permease subunit